MTALSNGFNATFEQHASVPGLEAAGLALLGYSSVNVAQKLTLGLSGNNRFIYVWNVWFLNNFLLN